MGTNIVKAVSVSQAAKLTGGHDGIFNLLPVLSYLTGQSTSRKSKSLLSHLACGVKTNQLCMNCLMPLGGRNRKTCAACGTYATARKEYDLGKRFKRELDHFMRYAGTNNPRKTVIVMVSGGLDSAVTLHLVKKYFRCKIVAVTVEHSWTKTEAVAFAARLCRENGIRQYVLKTDSLGCFRKTYPKGFTDEQMLAFPWCHFCVGATSNNYPQIESIAKRHGAKGIILGSNYYTVPEGNPQQATGEKKYAENRRKIMDSIGFRDNLWGPSLIAATPLHNPPILYFSINPVFGLTHEKRKKILAQSIRHPLRKVGNRGSDCMLYPAFDASVVRTNVSNPLMFLGGSFAFAGKTGRTVKIATSGSGLFYEYQSGFLDAFEYIEAILEANSYSAEEGRKGLAYLRDFIGKCAEGVSRTRI